MELEQSSEVLDPRSYQRFAAPIKSGRGIEPVLAPRLVCHLSDRLAYAANKKINKVASRSRGRSIGCSTSRRGHDEGHIHPDALPHLLLTRAAGQVVVRPPGVQQRD